MRMKSRFILIFGNSWSCCCYWGWAVREFPNMRMETDFTLIFGNSRLLSSILSTQCSHHVHEFPKKRMETVSILLLGNSRLFTHRSSKYVYLRATYDGNGEILHLKTCNLWDLQKKTQIAHSWPPEWPIQSPPPHRRSPTPTKQSMQRPNDQQQRLSNWAVNFYAWCWRYQKKACALFKVNLSYS